MPVPARNPGFQWSSSLVIDVGINRVFNSAGVPRLVGDVVFSQACARASHITLPGGVGLNRRLPAYSISAQISPFSRSHSACGRITEAPAIASREMARVVKPRFQAPRGWSDEAGRAPDPAAKLDSSHPSLTPQKACLLCQGTRERTLL